ncbi:MAG: orotidine-5'-phosphate decarboxylase [Planctomycetota bacterium]
MSAETRVDSKASGPFADRLEDAVRAKGSACLVGLDPHLASIPPEYAAVHDATASRAERAAAMGDFLVDVIAAVADLTPAVKPQSAFFEALGADGVAQWERVVAAARDAGLLVIGDVKRGDIGSTAAAYAEAFLTGVPGTDPRTLCDAVTLNPYLGTDSVQPFLDACKAHGTGVYVLVRTSNPSSSELQAAGAPSLAEQVASLVDRWGAALVGGSGLSSVGAVVGATHPDELARFRALLPRTPFLIPGYGAQGGAAHDVVGGFMRGHRDALRGAIINSSRGILYAYRERPGLAWQDAARAALRDMGAAIGAAVRAGGSASLASTDRSARP